MAKRKPDEAALIAYNFVGGLPSDPANEREKRLTSRICKYGDDRVINERDRCREIVRQLWRTWNECVAMNSSHQMRTADAVLDVKYVQKRIACGDPAIPVVKPKQRKPRK